jgi:hypothetical protein
MAEGLPVLVGYILQAVADNMNHTPLMLSFWIDCFYGITDTWQVI